MKLRLLFPLLCSVLIMTSCTAPDKPGKPDEDGPETPSEPEKEKPKPGIYKFVIAPDMASKATVSTAGKTVWEEGDEILVTGGYSPGAITVKLKSSDISADGKTATVNLDKVPESTFGPDSFYAAWPAGELDQEEMFTEDTFIFKTTDAPLMCAWLDGDTFAFKHICAAVGFSVSGDYDGCVFAGNNWKLISHETWGVQLNSTYEDYAYRSGTSGYFINKDLKDGGAVIYFPNIINLTEGFKIFMRKGNTYPKVYEVYPQDAGKGLYYQVCRRRSSRAFRPLPYLRRKGSMDGRRQWLAGTDQF